MKEVCPKPGHLVRARNWSDSSLPPARNTALVVDARGIEVQVMINSRFTWIRRDRVEVVSESR